MELCWLIKGQKPNEQKQPILWTKWPTSAIMGVGSFWP